MLHLVRKIEKMSNYSNFVDGKKKSLNTKWKNGIKKRWFNMERKHIAEEIHFNLKELFEICSDVIYQSDEGEDVRGVLKVAKALIMHTSYADGNHFSEEEKLYELADEFLGGFYEENGIEQLYDIDDAEY